MKISFIAALLISVFAGFVQLTAVAAPGTAAPPPATASQKSPGDTQIDHTLRAKLVKSKMNADHFTFTVSKGVVTIEGSTGVMQHKGAMTRMAKTSGAIAVRNNIRISDAAKSKAVASLTGGRKTPAETPVAAANGKAAPASIEPTAAPQSVGLPRAVVLPAGATR